MIDTPTALEAADNWRRLAELVPLVRLYLEPRRGHNEAGRTAPKSRPPIDLGASDLLHELDMAASLYCSALLMETDDVTRLPATLEDQLRLIAQRHGHFTADPDEKIAHDFCDEAHELVRKVETLIVRPLPPYWAGPCTDDECEGSLTVPRPKPHNSHDDPEAWDQSAVGTCDTCGKRLTPNERRDRLAQALDGRLAPRDEVLNALKILGAPIKPERLRQWVHRRRLVPAVTISDVEYYRLTDAMELAGIERSA